jgi:hypothetical protein
MESAVEEETPASTETGRDASLDVPAIYVNRFQFFLAKNGETIRIGLGEASPRAAVFHTAVAMLSSDARIFANAILRALDKKEKALRERDEEEVEDLPPSKKSGV